jgi:hypothetical protein
MKVWQNRWAGQAAMDKTGKEAARLARTGKAEGQGSKVERRRICEQHANEETGDRQCRQRGKGGKANRSETDRARNKHADMVGRRRRAAR